MKICPITLVNQQQNSYRGQFPIDASGGARLVPEWYAEEAAKKTTESVSLLVAEVAEKTAEAVSLFGKFAAGFAALIGFGALLAHDIDKHLAETGDMDTSDVFNPDRDRMYM